MNPLLNMYNKSIYLFGEPSSKQLDDNILCTTNYGQSPRTKVTIVMEFSTCENSFSKKNILFLFSMYVMYVTGANCKATLRTDYLLTYTWTTRIYLDRRVLRSNIIPRPS